MEVLKTPSLCANLIFSPDGTLMIAEPFGGGQFLVLGIPSVINVRSGPSLTSAVTGYISGEIVVGGVDPSGQFYLMESHGGGWISADATYVDLGDFSTEDQLRMLQP